MTTPAPAKKPLAQRPGLWGAVLAAALLVVLVVWFGRASWGGWWLLDRHVQPDTYVLGTIYERWAGQVKGGDLPLWFPEFRCGSPVHAAWMYGLFYPPLGLFLLLPPEAAFTWYAMLHVVFGAVGMYAFLWRERGSATAAACGAVVFGMSGFMLGRVLCGHVNLVAPFAWAPWTMLAAVRIVREGRGTGLFALSVGLGLLAGHVQIWFYVAPCVALLALTETSRAGAWRTAGPRLVLGAALALGVAAIQWLPAAELFFVSRHPREPFVDLQNCSATARTLAAQIAPGLVGAGDPFDHESLGLAGPLAVGATLFAFRLRDKKRLFWFGVLVVGLVMATGVRTSAGELLLEIPPFRWARTPGRAMTLVVLAGSVLSGHAVADLLGRHHGRWRMLVPAAFAASALLCGVAAPDVVRADFQKFDWAGVLPAGATEHRVHVNALRHPFVEARGIRTMRDVCPLEVPGFRSLVNAQLPPSEGAWWFDVAGVLDAPWWTPPDGAAHVRALAERAAFRPSVPGGAAQFFPSAARLVSTEDFVQRLRAGERALWVEETTRDVEHETPTAAAPTHEVVRAPTSSPRALSFRVEPPEPGWVLVSEKWYPGWKAFDAAAGDWRPVARGNLGLIAVRAEDAGRIEYRPGWLTPALIASAASLVAAVVLVVRATKSPSP